ncbi:flavin reductase family protein [Devosia sp. A369]
MTAGEPGDRVGVIVTTAEGWVAFDCALVTVYAASTHSVLFGEVRAVQHHEEAVPLLDARGSFRRPSP